MAFAIKVIWFEGDEEYLHPGTNPTGIAMFRTRREADKTVEFMKQGMADEVQSINVVPYPKRAAQPGGLK